MNRHNQQCGYQTEIVNRRIIFSLSHAYLLFFLMYSRILFVPDFERRFFVRCAQIYEAYLDSMLIKFVCIWRKNSGKSRYKRDSESTFYACVPILQVQINPSTLLPEILILNLSVLFFASFRICHAFRMRPAKASRPSILV